MSLTERVVPAVAALVIAIGSASCSPRDGDAVSRASAASRGAGTQRATAVSDTIDPSVTLDPPQGTTRTIDFMTDEGTWMALDVAPDGRWLVFDLLGQVYRMPLSGGQATCLTQNSGMALNFHPTISADGRRIAFISDRQGQNNVWVMNADGSSPKPVFLDRETRFMHPAWAPDGRNIVAVRVYPTPGRGWHRQMSELWRLPLDGGRPVRLLGERLMHYDAPSFSPDGRHLYFHVSYSTGEGAGMLVAGHRIQRLELRTGRVENVRSREPPRLSSAYVEALRRTGWAEETPGDPPAALTPVVSPDGQWVAFGLEQQGKSMVYRGHEFTPRTALAVRNLATGEERVVLDTAAKDLTLVNMQYAYGVFPRFAWTPDGKSLVAWAGGKLRRIDVATRAVADIPFRARARRVLSEMSRSRQTIDDSSFLVKFIQWPTASPDGKGLAFVGVGKVWMMDLPNGVPRPLTADTGAAIQLTPAWSPDGTRVAFTSWNDTDGGQVWVVSADGTGARRISTSSAEYIYPTWTPDGSALVVSRGPGPRAGAWNGWNSLVGWAAVRLPVSGGAATTVVTLSGAVRTYFGPGGRLYFQDQEHAGDAGLLWMPFPSAYALGLRIRVRSTSLAGDGTRDHVSFPAGSRRGSEPVMSPTGRWVAFQSSHFVFVSPIPTRPPGDSVPRIDPDPNDVVPGRVRVFDGGGVYYTWRDSTTLQFASGDRYVTFDAVTGRTQVTPIDLRVPRPTPPGAIALTNAKVITVDGDKVIEHGVVVVRGSRLVCVGAAGTCDTSGVERVLDLSGKAIIPGLFDMHAHHTGEASGIITPHRPISALDMAYGVTTILDPATSSESAFPLAEMIEAGVIVGPRTYSSAEYVIYPGTAWGDQQILRTQADADREVDRRADWGAASIKNYRQAGRYQQQMLLRAARRRGISVTSEGGPLYFDVGQVMDGQTGWEHFIANLPIYSDASRFFGAAGIVYSPTVIVAGHIIGSNAYFRPRQHLATDAKYRRFASSAELKPDSAARGTLPKSTFSFPIIAEGVADIVRAGGHAVLGEHGEQPGIGTHWELWAYAEALRPLEALRVATLDAAYSIGLEHETGSLAAGKLADLVVLNADPLADIHNTANIAYVMKAGHLYDAGTLDELWPGRRPYGPIPWLTSPPSTP